MSIDRQQRGCQSTRLAAGDVASVDLCSCGVMQLHLGAITVRLAPDAMASLLRTLRASFASPELLRRGEFAAIECEH